MNCISTLPSMSRQPLPRPRRPAIALLLLLVCSNSVTAATPATADARSYRLVYSIQPDPSAGLVKVSLQVGQSRALLRELQFSAGDRIDGVAGDGNVIHDGHQVRWQPPASGGTLSWTALMHHRRNGDGFDALLNSEWGLFRAEDAIPRSRTRTLAGAHSETWMAFRLPRHWSVATQYFDMNGRFRVDNARRRFDQPSGWIVMGKLGIRREIIAGTHVAVAAPVNQSVHRMDMLALLHWTLPEMDRLLPSVPRRLTIVSAGDPMWRGGLSAPRSIYVHAERPLISENATSTLLHEVMHVSLGLAADADADWVLEGLAEYYSLELLRRSGTISETRYQTARRDVAEWSKSATVLCGPASSGATTALAVTILGHVDREIRKTTAGASSLDDLARALSTSGRRVSVPLLIEAAAEIAGGPLESLRAGKLPGCAASMRKVPVG
jgi:hypothetical protein